MKKRGVRSAKTAIWLLLALSICVMAASLYKLREIRTTYSVGTDHYSRLADRARSVKPGDIIPQNKSDGESDAATGLSGKRSGVSPEFADTSNGAPPAVAGGLLNVSTESSVAPPDADKIYQKIEIPDISVDIDALRALIPDAAAWLYSPDTAIDYPVMRADDYDYYLRRLPDGTENANGSLFIDYNCAPDFTGGLTVVYGHHMKSGQMFGSLMGYKKQAYFDAHPYIYLYADNANYRIDLLFGFVIGADEWRERAYMLETNTGGLLAYAARKTTFVSGAEYTQDDKFIALYTCAYDFEGASYVVIGVMRPEYGGG